MGVETPMPAEGLWIYDRVYKYNCLDEMAINAYWCGRPRESLELNDRLLSSGFLPESEIQRIHRNRATCIADLQTKGEEIYPLARKEG